MATDPPAPPTARTVMDPEPTVVQATDVIRTAARYIMRHRYRSVPIVDEHRRYLGTFGVNCLLGLVLPRAVVMDQGLATVPFAHETLHDLLLRFEEVADEPVTMCMDKGVATVAPDTPLLETLLVLYRSGSSVPVVEPDDDRLLGVVSYWDAGERILGAKANP